MRGTKFAIEIALLLLCAASAFGQSVSPKWESLSGEAGEILAYIPSGYLVARDTDYAIPTDGKRFEIRAHVVAARLFNSTVFLYEMYEGNVEGLEKHLSKADVLSEKRVFAPFTVSSYTSEKNGRTKRAAFYNNGKRLYVLSSNGRDGHDSVTDAFFASVRLKLPSGWVNPLSPESGPKITLPHLVEISPERVDDAHPVDIKDVDRAPIILFRPGLNWSAENRNGWSAGKIVVRILLSSSGVVTKADLTANNFFTMKEQALKAAKRTIFIPAEKDGKLVSVFTTVTNSYEASTTTF